MELTELVEYMAARERIQGRCLTIEDAMAAFMPELDAEGRLGVVNIMLANTLVSAAETGDLESELMILFLKGVELGRELEKRV